MVRSTSSTSSASKVKLESFSAITIDVSLTVGGSLTEIIVSETIAVSDMPPSPPSLA